MATVRAKQERGQAKNREAEVVSRKKTDTRIIFSPAGNEKMTLNLSCRHFDECVAPFVGYASS